MGSGHWHRAIDALLLFGVNVVSINLAAVVTFVAHGIRPHHWWEAERGKKARRAALSTWVLLLLLLILIMRFHEYRQHLRIWHENVEICEANHESRFHSGNCIGPGLWHARDRR
jgi:hypothetical protein